MHNMLWRQIAKAVELHSLRVISMHSPNATGQRRQPRNRIVRFVRRINGEGPPSFIFLRNTFGCNSFLHAPEYAPVSPVVSLQGANKFSALIRIVFSGTSLVDKR